MTFSTIYLLFSILAVACFDANTLFAQAKGLRAAGGRLFHHQRQRDDDQQPTRFESNAHVRFTGLPADATLTPQQAMFFDDCFKAAYESYNPNPDVHVDRVSIIDLQQVADKDVDDDEDDNNDKNLRQLRIIFDFSIFMWWFGQGGCGSLCFDMLWDRRRELKSQDDDDKRPALRLANKQAHIHWERALCSMLQQGPFEIFRNVDDCSITL